MTESAEFAIIISYYPTAANTVQISVQIHSDIAQLFFTVENLFAGQVGTRTQNCHTFPLSFTDKFIDYSSWIINLFLHVFASNIALYF